MTELPDWAVPLGLRPHPEGGWYAGTWRSPVELAFVGYDGPRALATSIVFLLMPGEESAWHVVRSDELWIHQRGGPLVLGLGGADPDGPGPESTLTLGTDPGQAPQAVVPGGFWQTARPAADEPVLVGCVVTPGFDFRDFRLA